MPKNTTNIDDLLAANERRATGGICSIGVALAAVDAPTRAKLQAALDDRARFAHNGLANVFGALGVEVGEHAVQRHRNGRCKCPT